VCNIPLCDRGTFIDADGVEQVAWYDPPCDMKPAPSLLPAVAATFVTTTLLTYFDRRANKRSIAANTTLRVSYARERESAEAENRRRWAAHQVRITLTVVR